MQRFIDAQEPLFEQVLAELNAGKKETHWMWYFFPQFKGLGRSVIACRYEIQSIEEAKEYASHLVLGRRLAKMFSIVLLHENSIDDMFSKIDAMKYRSCLELFGPLLSDNFVF